MRDLRGVCTAMVTPFDEQGELNLAALDPFLEFQCSAGIEGVVVAGTNGEGPSLSVEERKSLLEAVIARRRNLIVIAGTGAASVKDAVDLIRHAGEAGADGALVLPPFYFKNPSATGIANYYRQIMDASAIPVLLYSIPQQTAVPITDEILDLVCAHPRFGGLKDSAGDWDRTRSLVDQYRDRAVFPGSDLLLSRVTAAGAVGNISGTANGFPELVVGVARAVRNGGNGAAEQDVLNRAIGMIQKYPLIATNKSILARRGLPRMRVRPPLVDLMPQQEESLLADLESAGCRV